MVTRRRMRLIHAQLAWMVGTVMVLTFFGALSYELFFVLSLAGFFVVVGLTSPTVVTPAWRTRLRWFMNFGLLGFAVMVALRVVQILWI